RLVDVSHNSHQPEFAAKVINTLVEEFIEQNFENKYKATIRATDFLQKQLEQLKITVEHSEEDLTRYARQHGILNIDERGNIVLQKLADLNQERTRVQANLISKTARYQVVKDATVENFPQSLKNDLIIDLQKRLFELEQNLASLSERFGPDWPEVQNAGKEIHEVREQLGREKENTIREAKIEYRVAQDHYQMLSSALEEHKQLANQLNEDSIQYNILRREVETSKQLYEGLLQRLKEAGVSAGLKSSNIQVVDRGEVPREVYRPRKGLNLALGLMVGLMLGVGLAFLTEYLDDTLKTPDQVEELLALPSLGVIPAIGKPRDGTTHLLPAGATDAQSAAILPYTPAGSRIWEAYRSFRTSLVLSSSGQQPKTILVTSSFTGEGKTTTAINAGIVFAQTGARTLLIDLDMRKPMLARRFGMGRSDGMSTFLSGNSDLSSQIRQTAVRSLFVLPGGPIPPNPAELMGSERMEEVLRLLAQYFEYIVIDSPPVLSVTDALVLSPQVDGVVMVIHGGKTPRDAVRRADAHLRDVGAKILGALINNVDMESSDYYYYYRHYYDYGYHETTDQADHVG
ncbi:MAG: polysaccharide biosynthesis tyrosine autokinase, partial [Acidobacteria bacterium]|nr:polysaccharide biosynthesis tyrosine autokinase [Acidobacteriota bacterium]